VPQSFLSYASEIGENLFVHHFDSTATNTCKLRVNSFGLCFVHIGLCDTTKNSLFIGWNMCYSLQYSVMCSSRVIVILVYQHAQFTLFIALQGHLVSLDANLPLKQKVISVN
jgi:hypothetical protein